MLLRCVQLEADSPRTVFGYDARELFAEPPAKSHEARNYAVFGSYKLNAHDSYQFWRAQSPFWVYPLTLFFSAFGVDYPQLRVFSTLYAAAGLALLLVIGARFMRATALVFVGLTIGLDAMYFHTARVGFIEPAVSSWLTLMMLALLLAEQRAIWLNVALVSFTIAFFTKQGALFAAPVVLGAVLVRLRAHDARRERWRVLGCAVALLLVGSVYIASTDYARAAVHNYKHLALGYDAPGEQVSGLRSILMRLVDIKRYQHLLASVPVSGPLAFATTLVLLFGALKRRRWPSYGECILLGWALCATAAMGALANSALRFWTVLIHPAALLAGIGVDRAMRALESTGRARLAPALLGGAALWLLAWNGAMHSVWLGSPSYSVRDASSALQRAIGDVPATVIGTLSPWVVLSTPYRNFYVRPRTNSEPGKLVALGITHLLSRDLGDAALDISRREFSERLQPLAGPLRLTIRGETTTLFEVATPGVASLKAGQRSEAARRAER